MQGSAGADAYAAQVASHAQKYFIRLNSMNKKDKRRSSIHDITSPGGITGDITGAHPACMQRYAAGALLLLYAERGTGGVKCRQKGCADSC